MDEDKKVKKHSSSGIPFGLEVLLFIIVIFIIWVFMGGAKKPVEEKPFITSFDDPVNPGMKYNSEDVKNNYQQNPNPQFFGQ